MQESKQLCCSTRLIVAFLVLIGACIQYCQKIDLSVNILCMVSGGYSNETSDTLKWDKSIQGLLLSSFFWGLLFSQVLSGILASKFGPKWIMIAAMTMNGFAILLYPTAARSSYKIFLALRLVVGFSAGVIFPCITQIWTKWGPKIDRSTLVGISASGAHLGSVITLPLGGFLCSRFGNNGWPMLFYIIGSSSIIWAMAWTFYFSNSPRRHRFISDNERRYITTNTLLKKKQRSRHKIPWIKILTNRACWAQFVIHACMSWGFYTLLTCMPMYMAEVLKFNIKTNGILSAVPFFSVWITTVLSGRISDVLIKRNYISRTRLRKAANLLGSVIPATCVLGLCLINASTNYIAVILLTVANAFFGIAFGSGFMCVCNDLSSRFAGVLFGISNTFATIPGIISPYFTAMFTYDKSAESWRMVFILLASIWIFGGLEFLAFGSGDEQFDSKENCSYNEDENVSGEKSSTQDTN
ncbi:hypothetical protein ACOME3_005378 [Neoechinorhynchus agilis]